MLVRIVETEIQNFKNVEYGLVKFANYAAVNRRAALEQTDIEGVYGQNGSGKTALVETMDILRIILSGRAVSAKDFGELVDVGGNTVFRLKLYIENNEKKYLVDYEVNLFPAETASTNPESLPIFQEKLSYSTRGVTWKGHRQLSVTNSYYNPDTLFEQSAPAIIQDPESAFDEVPLLSSSDKLILISSQKGTSVFFNDIFEKHLRSLENIGQDTVDLLNIIRNIRMFARVNFQVVKVNRLGAINLKTFFPLMIHEKTKESISHSDIFLSLQEHNLKENNIEERFYELLKNALPALNIALSSLVPNLKIELRETDRTVREDKTYVHVSIEVIRYGKRFSIRYESEGIQRIISILSYLIALYNDPQICLVVDEFDDGIFEYLLGELIGVLGKEARGQLIFTSHNLRVLEKLNYKRILCTTTNPKNRYIRLSGVGANNNKRDFYLRTITIGGQQEELYDDTDLQNISASFRRAYAYKSEEEGNPERERRLKKLQLSIAKVAEQNIPKGDEHEKG